LKLGRGTGSLLGIEDQHGGSRGRLPGPEAAPARGAGRLAGGRLRARARERWPQIASLHIRHRGDFSYVDATLTDDTTLKLC
jgi:hypothetical protein